MKLTTSSGLLTRERCWLLGAVPSKSHHKLLPWMALVVHGGAQQVAAFNRNTMKYVQALGPYTATLLPSRWLLFWGGFALSMRELPQRSKDGAIQTILPHLQQTSTIYGPTGQCPHSNLWGLCQLALTVIGQTLTGLNLFSPDSDQWFRWSPAEGLLKRLELRIQNWSTLLYLYIYNIIRCII